jgi:hypothetical protein
VEDLLKDPDLGIIYRPIALVYDEKDLPTHSTRPGQHPGFMVISDKMTAGGKHVSLFTLSKARVRKTIVQLPCQKLKDCVNPLAELPKGDFNAERDISKSQRRKQWFSGWKYMENIRAKLWKGVSVSDRRYAARIDVYGYDFSLGQCIQRSVFRSEKERTKQPNEMVCTLFWASMDTTIDDHWTLLQDFHDRIG